MLCGLRRGIVRRGRRWRNDGFGVGSSSTVNYEMESYEIVGVALFALVVLALIADGIRRLPRVRRMARGARKASYALVFLGVLGALLTFNWLHAGGDASALSKVLDPVADEIGASEAEDALDRLMEWGEAGGCSCPHANDHPEDVPDSKAGEVIECCIKEYCRLHNHRDPRFCECVGRYYEW